MRERGRRRWGAVCGCAVVALLATACPPDTPPPASPYACAAEPVSLGAAYQAVAISDDGAVVVLLELDEGDPRPFRYVVVDRRAGTRKVLATAAAGSDGVDVFLDRSGRRALLHRFAPIAEGDHPWSIVELATRDVTPIDLPPFPFEVVAVSADLDAVLVDDVADFEFGPVRRIDLGTGESTPQALAIDGSEYPAGFNGSLTVAAVDGALQGATFERRLVDVSGGTMLRQVTIERDPAGFFVENRFVDGDTVLVTNGVPAGSAPDGVVGDSAFLLSLATGDVRRVDPGVADALTTWASADGTRSVFAAWRDGGALWLREEGRPHRRLPGTYHALADATVETIVTVTDGEAFVTCA